MKDGQRVRYLLEGGEPNPAKGCKECKEGQTGQLGGSIGGTSGNIYAERGEFYQYETDLYIPGIPGAEGLDYVFSREYQLRSNSDGILGQNWRHNYFERLNVQIDGSVVHDNGVDREDRYLLNDAGDRFDAPAEFFTRLKQLSDGSFELRFEDGTVKSFDTDGKLQEIRDRNDNFMSFQYNDREQLSRVIDTMGRGIEYRYVDSGVNEGKLQEIEDFFRGLLRVTCNESNTYQMQTEGETKQKLRRGVFTSQFISRCP